MLGIAGLRYIVRCWRYLDQNHRKEITMLPNNEPHDPDAFDSAGFADLLRDAVWAILLMLLFLTVLTPVWLP